MVTAAATGLSEALSKDELNAGLLYPRLTRLRPVSAKVARAVVRAAQQEGVDTNLELREMDDDALLSFITRKQWSPYEDTLTSNL